MLNTRKRMPSYRPWGSTEDGAIEFESMTTETLPGALEVIKESFFTDENTCRGVEILSEPGASSELEDLCLNAAQDGVSVVAIDVATGKVVGASFNKIQMQQKPGEKSAFEVFSETCKYKSSKALMDVMILVDSKVDLFKHYNVDCILEVMFLVTARSHRGKRIAELLMASSIEIARQLKCHKDVQTPVEIQGTNVITNPNCVPGLVSAIASSNYSQRIAEKLGFHSLAEIKFEDFVFNGKKVSERIDDVHKSWRLVAKRI
uniref:Lin-49_2 protein n=3 Tax=Fopius arisanus TaxID=64838 RepID=A0A0C9R5F0_9HYME